MCFFNSTKYPVWNKESQYPLWKPRLKEVFLSKTYWILKLQQRATCCASDTDDFASSDTCVSLTQPSRPTLNIDNRTPPWKPESRKYSFQKLTQLSLGNNVIDLPASEPVISIERYMCLFNSAEEYYLEQRETISTFKNLSCRKYYFQTLMQLSHGNMC
jgi:hypothetical protein